tara:strand:+ start:254 stop:412 length:159 start_codon:yes stop_codon:yes gene_type:complete
MREIDNMLNQWIHNIHIRTRLRELIVAAIDEVKPKPSPYILDESDYVDEDED